jgi:hypothetical protein
MDEEQLRRYQRNGCGELLGDPLGPYWNEELEDSDLGKEIIENPW